MKSVCLFVFLLVVLSAAYWINSSMVFKENLAGKQDETANSVAMLTPDQLWEQQQSRKIEDKEEQKVKDFFKQIKEKNRHVSTSSAISDAVSDLEEVVDMEYGEEASIDAAYVEVLPEELLALEEDYLASGMQYQQQDAIEIEPIIGEDQEEDQYLIANIPEE